MAIQWYFRKDQREHGPVTSADLRMLASVGMLLPTDAVRKAGMTRWAKASALKGLFPTAMPDSPPAAVKTPPLSSPPIVTVGSSKWIAYFTVAAVVVAVSAVVYRCLHQPVDTQPAARSSNPIHPPSTEPILAAEMIDPLILAISSQSPFARGMALRQVNSTSVSPKIRSQVHQIICDTLDDRAFASIWSTAASALSEVGSPEDLPKLQPLIEKAPVETQCAAMATSMMLNPQAGVKLFEPHASDDQYGSITARYLADCGSRSEPVALEMLKSPAPMCRYYALYLLKSFGTPRAVEAINRARSKEPDRLNAESYQLTIDTIQSRKQ